MNCMCVLTADAMVTIRLHKKADLLERKVNSMKDRKVHADKHML